MCTLRNHGSNSGVMLVLSRDSEGGQKDSRPASSAPDKDNLFPFSCKNFHLINHSWKMCGSVMILVFHPVDVLLLPHNLLKRLATPLNWFCTFVKNQLVIPTWEFMSSLQFDWSKSWSLHHDHSLGCYRNAAGLNIAWNNSFYVILLQDCSSCSSACAFPYTFENIWLCLQKSC